MAAENLLGFCQYTTPWYQTPRHIQLAAWCLEALEAGHIDRLIIQEPPRHGKSQLMVRFLAWYIGRNPSEEIICASYNAKLASRFGRFARNLVDSRQYAHVFPGVSLSADSQAKDLWDTSHGGTFLSTGIKGGSTGFGANLLAIDDPIKGRKDADSETIRQDIEHWYSGEAYPRLMPRPNGLPPAVLMQYTPWHEEDLGQKEIRQMELGDGDQWVVLRMPAVAEEGDILGRPAGEALWPERYDRTRLDRIKRVLNRLNPRDWPALFQCRPSALDGNYFKRAWFRPLPATLPPMRCYLVTDWGAGGDETVHAVWGADRHGDSYLRDLWAESCDTGQGTEQALDMAAQWREKGEQLHGWIMAKGPIDKAVAPHYRLKMKQRGIHLRVIEYAETKKKTEKALSIQGLMSGGSVFFDVTASWFPELLEECIQFQEGAKKDNRVDVLAMWGLHVDKSVRPAAGPVSGVAQGGDFDVMR